MSAGHQHGGHAHGTHGSEGTESEASRGLRIRLWIVFSLTAIIVLAQAIGAWVTGSLALLTDTAHALTDASGLLVALIAASLMHKPANPQRTWGFRRIEVIAALAQATLLLVVGTYAAIEGIRRLFNPEQILAKELLIFGIIGLCANLIGIAVLASGRDANFNMRAAFLEVLNDSLGSLGVIVAAIVITTTGFYRADAIAGMFIAGLILPRAARLIRDTTRVLMEFTPEELDLDEVRSHIMALDHVKDVHDVHATTVATGLPTLTAHVVLEDECFRDGHAADLLVQMRKCVAEHFELSVMHTTFQLETQSLSQDESEAMRHP